MGTGILAVSIIAIGCAAVVMFCLFGTLASYVRPRRRARRERAEGLRIEEGLSGGLTESVAILDASPSGSRDRLLLRTQRRVGFIPQRNEAVEHTGGPVRQLTSVWTGPETGARGPDEAEGRTQGPIHQVTTDPRAGVRVYDPAAEISPPEPSTLISEAHSSQVTSRRSRPTPPFTPRRISDTIISGSMNASLALPESQSTHRRTLSATTGASRPSTMYTDSIYPVSTLPSYPGTARSASPPAYSVLSGTWSGRRTRASSLGESNFTESVVELTPNIGFPEG